MNLVATGAAGDFQDEAYITADQYLLVDEKAAATFGNFDRQPFVDMVVVAVDYQCRSQRTGTRACSRRSSAAMTLPNWWMG